MYDILPCILYFLIETFVLTDRGKVAIKYINILSFVETKRKKE